MSQKEAQVPWNFERVREGLQACIGQDLEHVILTNYTPQKTDYYQCKIQKETLLFSIHKSGKKQQWELAFDTQMLLYDEAPATTAQWQHFSELVAQLIGDTVSDRIEVVSEEAMLEKRTSSDNPILEQPNGPSTKSSVLTSIEVEKVIGGIGIEAQPICIQSQSIPITKLIIVGFGQLKRWVSENTIASTVQ